MPYDSLVAVERAARRLRVSGILNEPGTALADASWKPQLEKLLDGYLRLHPEIREQIRARAKMKQEHRANYLTEALFGFQSTERVLIALAMHGPMTRGRLRSITMLTHQNKALRPLIKAGILAIESRTGSDNKGTRAHGTRKNLVVGLNAAFPVYQELRSVLLALDGQAATGPAVIQDLSSPQKSRPLATRRFRAPERLRVLLETAP